PKIVDHESRRRQLAEATWRVIQRDGLEGVSVRNVAREAGMSVGALRHYFASQSELLAFALNLVGERIKERIAQMRLGQDLRGDIEAVVEQVLPLDEERTLETMVWLAFLGRTLVDDRLAKLAASTHGELAELFRQVVELLAGHGLLSPDADVEIEARRFHALVDGLALHVMISEPRPSADEVRRIIHYHLERLTDRRWSSALVSRLVSQEKEREKPKERKARRREKQGDDQS
ncbi:MAG TPA: TetR/AcrR family transcriptional regulator, partial [Limnochordia bacterium]|nr:TetR/AcrR family transcriptional regulator [Limnochordia bacterium]